MRCAARDGSDMKDENTVLTYGEVISMVGLPPFVNAETMMLRRTVSVKARWAVPLVAATVKPVPALKPPLTPAALRSTLVVSQDGSPPSSGATAAEPAREAWLDRRIASMSLRSSVP